MKSKKLIIIIKEEMSSADGSDIFTAEFDDGTPVDYTSKKRDVMIRYLKTNYVGCQLRFA